MMMLQIVEPQPKSRASQRHTQSGWPCPSWQLEAGSPAQAAQSQSQSEAWAWSELELEHKAKPEHGAT
jgi:hypothetical protein